MNLRKYEVLTFLQSTMRTFTLISTLSILASGSFAQLTDDAAARCPKLPDMINPFALPDPFTFYNGQPVRTKADWACRRAEIAELLQRFELGSLPKSKATVKGTLYDDGEFGVAVTDGGKSIAFNVTIRLPGATPAPTSTPVPTPAPTEPAPEDAAPSHGHAATGTSSRGQGLFYDLYGKDHPAGAIIASAWGISRLIDALEQVPEARIDTKHLGVTGCSRFGKAALIIGAFEERIALTIPEEGGTGGAGCWRIADGIKRRGINIQTPSQIITENTWFGPVFDKYASNAAALPTDHHLLTALIAPRAVYIPENGYIDWLGPESTWGCQNAAKTVWKALGVEDRIGFEQTGGAAGGHNHCQFPAQQAPGIVAFADRFLKGKKADTSKYFRTEATFPDYNEKEWITWDTPRLA
ncbi:hypothetical protein FA13DRAFT_1815336 [Coprinellus micaceus]|uniref:(4-O-methyl)-D-glucuronate--lignin esterase n=1 Tax=Coprinellus micaceus TaxID=71717 RepID=A0A4Y7T4T0_COPMI|nr:hypothetical protein FA13DRAFT_1815336 [Coprinellus micaceus]